MHFCALQVPWFLCAPPPPPSCSGCSMVMAIVSSDNGTCTCYAHALHAIQGQVGSGWTQAQMVDSTLALSSAKQIRKAFHRHLSAFLSVGQSKANPHASRHATQLLPSLHDQCPLSNCDTAQCVSAFVQDHKRGPAYFWRFRASGERDHCWWNYEFSGSYGPAVLDFVPMGLKFLVLRATVRGAGSQKEQPHRQGGLLCGA